MDATIGMQGGLAEYAVVPTKMLYKLTTNISSNQHNTTQNTPHQLTKAHPHHLFKTNPPRCARETKKHKKKTPTPIHPPHTHPLIDTQAALLEPLGVAHHACEAAEVTAGDDALVIGCGAIGLLCIQVGLVRVLLVGACWGLVGFLGRYLSWSNGPVFGVIVG